MFKIGEFARIAQVSGRLLRYYDEIGLLKPAHVDVQSGYRYYMAEQLPRLNRILALKDLGLSLDQIGRMLDGAVSADEIRGMLMIRKAQIEQSLREEVARLRQVEVRLRQIEQEGSLWTADVVVKPVAEQPIVSYRQKLVAREMFRLVGMVMGRALGPGRETTLKIGLPIFVLYSEAFSAEVVDIELGYQLEGAVEGDMSLTLPALPDDTTVRTLSQHTLPAVPQMATLVHRGWDDGVMSYNALGDWIQANGYRIVGPSREVILSSQWPHNRQETVFEIQFPVEG